VYAADLLREAYRETYLGIMAETGRRKLGDENRCLSLGRPQRLEMIDNSTNHP
jgi:hypothetical protein